ncbi:hypothetical protein C464_17392 [Halorubrum coriense DSM 10284]|uniref:Uncharacterized protein n=2 Tax=Halorubrum coriense TaxID=64713 RepID=M0E6T3_9EURY|nr:hypothetical protein C464_17392 [Halorubrum coriense DSM 10284]
MTQVSTELARTVRPGEGEVEFEDPFYDWGSASPFDSARPSVILHVSPENRRGDSLALLQRRLRDEYTYRRGGEPEAKRVRMIAGKPKIPNLSNTVATFDLTDEEWSLEARSESIRVERDGRDALEYVEAIVETGFAGDLGYLVVNVPSRWEDPLSGGDVFTRIHDRIAPPSGSKSDLRGRGHSGDGDEEPPLVTRCQPNKNADLPADASTYWFGQQVGADDSADLPSTIEGYEELFERRLRQSGWLRTVLTEEHDGNESNEHYLLKAAVAAGLVREDFQDEDGSTLEEYVFETILEAGKLETEHGDGPCVDIYTQLDGLPESFVPLPDDADISGNLIIEVETGRSEGGTNFRKLWHTIDRLADSDGLGSSANASVCIVVPPRLLARTDEQANYLCRLVSVWNRRVRDEKTDIKGPNATLSVPVFDERGDCVALKHAEEFIEEVYNRD